jgi:hypothetical protein
MLNVDLGVDYPDDLCPRGGLGEHPDAVQLEGAEFRLGRDGCLTWTKIPPAAEADSFPLFQCNAFQVQHLQVISLNR